MRAETNQYHQEADYDPNAGGVGFLTFDEYDRFVRAVGNARSHVAWWRIAGHIRLGDAEEHKSRSSDPMIPLPATWLAAEEIGNLLLELNTVPTLADAAHRLPEIAMLLTREVETAMAKWPMSDRPHKVRYLRCRACQQQTLKYYPPNLKGPTDAQHVDAQVRQQSGAVRAQPEADVRPTLVKGKTVYVPVERPATVGTIVLLDVTVKCTNKECGSVEDHAMFERDALLIEQEAKRGSRGRLGDGDRGTGPGEQVQGDGVQVVA